MDHTPSTPENINVYGSGTPHGKKPAKLKFGNKSWINPNFLIFVVIFAVIGGYIIFRSFAATVSETQVWNTASAWQSSSNQLTNTDVVGNVLSLSPNSSANAPAETATVGAAGTTDLALNKPAVASSSTYTGGTTGTALPPSNVDDGNLNTRWSSSYNNNQWIYVNLGAVYNISEVKLNWETAYAKAYEIQVSNDAKNWDTIYSTTSGTGGLNDLTGLSGVGQYVRMLGVTRATQWGFSLYEMGVYGSPVTNEALGLPSSDYTASSYNDTSGTTGTALPPSNAFDNNYSTRWSSNYDDNEWLQVNLGSVKPINTVTVDWETAYASSYTIEVSNNGTTWTTVYANLRSTGGYQVISGLNTKGQYVRMQGVARATQWGYSIYEMGVYSTGTASTAPTNPGGATNTYETSGNIILDFDANSTANWTSLTAVTNQPTGTAITYQVRTSSNNSSWSSWTTVTSGESLSSITANKYIEIEASLSTTTPSVTPTLSSLTLDYGITVTAPTISSFTASPTSIQSGASSVLTWASANTTGCTASGSWSGAQSTSGSVTVTPTANATYSLTCSGSGGTTSASSVTVTVTAASGGSGGGTTGSTACAPSGDTCLLNDEFTGTKGTVPSDWIVFGTNDGQQAPGFAEQSASNVFEDGAGHLVMQAADSGGTYTSSFIGTFTYNSGWPSSGPTTHTFTPPVHVEMTAEMGTDSDGWPGLWTMQTNSSEPVETDVAEEQMSAPTDAGCHMHQWSGDTDLKTWDCPGGTVSNMGTNFHTFGADFYSDKTVFYVDGNVIGTSTFGNPGPFGLLLQNAMGGWLGSQTTPSGSGPWDMLVTDVKAWTIPND